MLGECVCGHKLYRHGQGDIMPKTFDVTPREDKKRFNLHKGCRVPGCQCKIYKEEKVVAA